MSVITTPGPRRSVARSRWTRLAVAAAVIVSIPVFLGAVSGGQSSAAADPVIVAVGDIACDPGVSWFNNGNGTPTDCQEKATANLLPGADAVLPLGDEQYFCGGLSAFLASYDPSWGAQKSISHPVPGNHEYLTSGGTDCSSQPDASGYYTYFGSSAGNPTKGYYSYDIGTWHVIALNSECGYVASLGDCDAGSPEETWLRADLAAHASAPCTMAYWHRPRFASSESGGDRSFSQWWSDLYAAHADVVLNGHAHWYERFALQNASGQADANGIREFIVGTGGEESGSTTSTRLANSQVAATGLFGVLRMTLHPGSYDWNFVRVPGSTSTFTDSGSTTCHNAGTVADSTPPATTISCNASPCTSTPYGGTVTVALSATDSGGSGVMATRYTTDGTDPTTSASAVTYTAPFGVSQTTTVRFASSDGAGNQEAPQTQQIAVDAPTDTTAPATAISCNSAPCATTSYSGTVTVGLSATDTGGSGVSRTRYTTDGTDPTTSASAATYTAPFGVSQTTTVRFASSDNAGNQEAPHAQLIQVAAATDTTPPTTTISCDGATCQSGWYAKPSVSVGLSATDGSGSGVRVTRYTIDGSNPNTSTSAVTYTAPFALTQTTTVKYASTDNAGNKETVRSRQIRIDAAAPTVTVTAPSSGASFTRGTSVLVTASASDAASGSGLANVTFYMDGTTKLGTDSSGPYSVSWSTRNRALGTHTLTAVAKDAAGNVKTSTGVTVTLTR